MDENEFLSREEGGDRTSIHLQLRHGKSFIDLESESLAFKRVSNSLQTPKAAEPQETSTTKKYKENI